MRVAEYKQIDTKIVDEEVIIPAEYDDEGNVVTEEHTETVQKEKAVMGMVYRDATPEEIAKMESDESTTKLTIEDRVTILEEQVAELENK